MEYWEQFELADNGNDSVSFNQQEENITKNITDNVTNPNYKNNTFNAENGAQSNTLVPEYLQGQIIYNTPKKSAVDNVIHAFDMVKNLALIPIHAGKDRIIDNRAAELNTKAVLGTITDKEKEELDYLENRTDRYNFGIQPSVNHGVEDVAELNKNRFKKYVLQASGEGVVQIADTLKQGGIGGVVGAGVGAAGGAISGLVTGGPAGSLAGAFNGIKLGWKLGGGVGATKRAWEIETGFAYQEIKAMSNDMGINIDETLAKRLSLSVGVINAGLEMIGLDSLAKTSPYFNTVLQGAKQRLLKKSITDKAFQQTILKAGERTAQLLANNTAKNSLEYSAVMGEKNAINASLSNVLSDTAVKQTQKNLIKEATKETAKQGEEILENQSKAVVKAMITEPTTEVLQEVTNILSEELGKQIQGGYSDTVYSQNEDGSYNFNAHVARQNMARAVQAGVMALAPTIIMGGIGRVSTARNIAMKNGMTRKEADEFVNRLENNIGNSILDNDAVLNIAKENAKNKKFNRNVTDRYKELISQGYNEQDAYLGAIVNVSQKMGLIADGDLVSYINQHEDTLLKIASDEYRDDFYSEVEKQKHQEMLDNGYTEEQAFLGSTMLHAFLNANTISEQEKQNVLNSLYFKKETSEQTQSNELVLNQPMLEGINPEQNVDVVDLTSNFATDSQLSKKDLSNYIQSLIGSKPLTTKDKKAILNFVARSKRVGKKDVLVSEHIVNSSKVERNNKLERNTSIKNIVDLIKGSVIVEKTENKDKKTKPNVDNYLRFYVPVKINNDIFTVRIVAENNKNNNIFNIEVGNVYDLIIDKKMTYSTSPDNQGNLGKSSSDSIITDNSENFKPQQITIREMLKDVEDANGNVYFQPANIAGAENNEVEVAAKEWQEKGTDSKYFKKWFGDSKVVDENGKPLVVYHGTLNKFKTFDKNTVGDRYSYDSRGFFFTSSKNIAEDYATSDFDSSKKGYVMPVYISAQNPLVINKTFLIKENMRDVIKDEDAISFWDNYQDFVLEEFDNGNYDAIIIDFDDYQKMVVAFEPNQIKSVDNRGTFDAENPNIYFQSAYHGTPHRFDKFSTEHIGSGEGAQAHGWGLYFAGNKEISEDYRRKLSGDKVFYNGKELEKQYIYTHKYMNGENVEQNKYLSYLRSVIEGIVDIQTDKKISLEKAKQQFIENYESKNKLLAFQKKYLEIAKYIDVSKIDIQKGQLFEVDIPDDNVLLDEQKTFEEQSDFVKKVLSNSGIRFNKEDTGKIIYEKIGKEFTAKNASKKVKDKNASEYLNMYGIKGITYDGLRDGKSYVIFDDKAVEILKTYYQTGIEDIDNSEKYKNLPQELKDAIDYIFTGKSVYDVKGDEFPKNGKNLNERVFEYYKENFNNEITVDNIGKIKLDKRSIKDSIYHGINTDKINAFAAVPYVLQQGKIVDVTKENNPNEKRYLFVAPITLKGDDYFCEVVVKSNKDRQGFYIHEVELKEKLADVFSTAHHGTSTSSKSIIADLVNNFNPNEQLKNKIFNDTDLAGTDGKRHKTIEEIHEDVRARRTGEQYRGYFKSGKYSSIITLAENADATTIIHELGHFFLKTLNDLSAENKDIRDKLVAVDSWLGRVEGEDYTVSQQEKFATGFEAYLYMGKAPSRRIQSAFEMFKEWIKGIVNQDLLKRIDEHNIHAFEVRDVFDRIFNPNNEVYEEKRNKVEELLEKVERIRLGKGLNDLQKRHRECAYQIVSMATGKNIKYLKTILQSNSDSKRIVNAKERIQNLCENCGDNLSKNSYPMEWLEFYGNNVSLFEEGNDAELALRAFDDIVNRNYVTEVDEWGYIDDLDAQYQYLLKQYEKATEEDKQIVFNAMAEWIDRACGNDAMATEVYIEKMTFDTEEIDRLKKMDEFERAKEKILKVAREISYARLSKDETFKKTVLAIFDGLKFLTLSDKMRLAANVLECPNITFLEARIDSIMDIAKTMLEVNERKRLYRLISEEIAGTKNIKQNNRMVGKYDYTTNKLFDELRVLDKMTREQVREWLDAQDAFQEDLDENQFNTKLKRKFARVKSESAIDIDTQILKDLYDDLRKIKLTARNVKTEQELNKKLNLIDERDEVLKVLRQKKKDENILKKGYLNLFANWESALNTIFNLNIRNKYSALAQETKADGWAFEQKSKFEDEIAKIYGLKGWNFDREIIKNLATKFEVEQYTYKNIEGEYIVTPVTVSMNKMEILLAYMWDKNEVLHERMVNQFGEEQLFDLFDELTPQDKALGDLMLKLINGFYPQANKVFIQKYGIDLPKVQAYFPSVADRFNEVDLLNDYRQRSLAPSFTKERSASTFIPLKFFNPINLFYKHIDDMAKFIYMSDIADKINHVFRDVAVQKEIKERYGQRALRTFNQNMENFLYPQHEQSDELLKFLNSFIGNVIASCTAIRPVVTFKQLLSACNYSTEMPVDLWVKGFMKALAHPKSTINYMMKIPYLNARFNMGGSDEFSKNMIDNMQTSSLKKIHNLMMINVRLGDMGAIVFGGKPYIDYLINNEGLTEDEATEKFILQTQRTQQSGANSSLSVWQQNASKNPLWRMMTAFKNTQNQYTRLCVDSVINAINGDVSWKFAAKNLFMYLWFQPYLYISATSLGALRFINSGDNDGLLQDLMNSLFDWNKTALPIIGDILNQVQTALISKNTPFRFSSNDILNKLTKSLYDLLNDGAQTEDVISIIALMLNVKLRIPVESVMDMASGVGDIFDGEFERGFLKLMGYSSYRAAYAMGEDKEYLKQKRKETRKRKNQRKL